MAMPSSGCIALRECITNCTCSSISCAVTGIKQNPSSLKSLSECAGKTTPHAMSEFYGYSSIRNVDISIINDGSDGTYEENSVYGYICSDPSLISNECVDITICYCLSAYMCLNSCECGRVYACLSVDDNYNNTSCYDDGANACYEDTSDICSGTFTVALNNNNTDSICYYLVAGNENPDYDHADNYALLCIDSVNGTNVNASIGDNDYDYVDYNN